MCENEIGLKSFCSSYSCNYTGMSKNATPYFLH